MYADKRNLKHGFTMIELLMVIMLVAILSGVALPQYLNFQYEGKVASATQFMNNIKSSLKVSLSKARIACGQNGYPSANAIVTNSLLADNYCTATQLPDPEDRKLLTNSLTPPLNPITNLNTIVEVTCGSICTCSDVTAGYYYNPTTGDIGYHGLADCATTPAP